MTLPNELHPGFFSAGGGGDLGDTIEQSLRFHGGTLSRSQGSNDSVYSISWWVKRAELGSNQTMLTASFKGQLLRWASDDKFEYNHSATSGKTTQVFRDLSAWYHCLLTYGDGGDVVKFFVNGVNTNISTSSGGNSWGGTVTIGNAALEGYMAEMHYISGSIKATTDFGKYNEDGVWVPQNYSGSYGSNGFHLTFDSSQANGIGHDSSGNGNNFTASGFDTADVASYAGTIFTDHVNTGASATPNTSSTASTFTNAFTNAFDGDTSTRIYTSGAGSWIIFRPSTAIPMSTGLRIWAEGAYVNQVWLNGSNTSFTTTGTTTWQTIPIGSETQITNIAIQGTPSPAAGATLFAIEVDGVILVHNTDNDVDYFDTPTSNYATWNPLSALSANVSFSDANLRLGTTASQAWTPGYLTFGPFECGKPGKYYFEMNDDIGTGYKTCNFGVTDNLSISWSDWWWNTGNTLSWYPESGTAYRNGSSFSFSSASTSGGKAMAIDFEAGTINAYNAGSLVGSLTGSSSNLTAGTKYYIVAATSNSNSTTMPFNFGQMPFIYTPPDGYKALQTNNLPKPTIKDGSAHFQAILKPGSGDYASGLKAVQTTYDVNAAARGWDASSAASFGFDENYATYAYIGGTAGNWIIWIPQTPLTGVQNVRVWTKYCNNVGWNGAARGSSAATGVIGTSTDGWVEFVNPPSTITDLGVAGGVAGGAGRFGAVEVDFGNGYQRYTDPTILAKAQAAFPNGLWWIKDRANANQHQLLDSVRGGTQTFQCPSNTNTTYTAPSGSSIAWCWSAPTAFTGNNSGSITSSGATNSDAGFSIMKWTADGTNATIGHNLSSAPEFIIVKGQDSSAFYVWHTSFPATKYQALGATFEAFTSSGVWNDTAPTSTTISVGAAAGNAAVGGGDRVCYAWHSVEGYSKFGSYESNVQNDGPLVYLGFKPSLIIFKSVDEDTSVSWKLADSTRAPINLDTGIRLYAPSTAAETVHANETVDFLSNGFKVRGTSNSMNAPNVNQTFLYCAWAEHPFGGQNVPPATAR